MSPYDAFRAREQSLEEAYFRKKDAELVEKLRKVFETKRTKEELRKLTGITSEEVLDQLVSLEISGELLSAFRLYPLVEMAWADGAFDTKEARAVLNAAAQMGVPKDSQVMQRLEYWLHNGPREDARAAWRAYASELRKTLSPKELAEFREDLLKHAKEISEASGGILGMFFQVSPQEHRVIEEIRKALT
jgi:uncharacterized tellurite resistance protein B-like protein